MRNTSALTSASSASNKKTPIKKRTQLPTASQLYQSIMSTEDFGPVIRTMQADGVAQTNEECLELIKAFVQWLSIGATTQTESYLMFHGPVDEVFHAMILNTHWYFDFCDTHIGCYVHHDPLDRGTVPDTKIESATRSTILLLDNIWGEDLHPHLKQWVSDYHAGELQPNMVSCVCNGE